MAIDDKRSHVPPVVEDTIEPIPNQAPLHERIEDLEATNVNQNGPAEILQLQSEQTPDIPYTVMTESQKISTIIISSFAALISPMSSGMYYPALNSLAASLHVTPSTINLTITVYMVSSPRICLIDYPALISQRSFKASHQHSLVHFQTTTAAVQPISCASLSTSVPTLASHYSPAILL